MLFTILLALQCCLIDLREEKENNNFNCGAQQKLVTLRKY